MSAIYMAIAWIIGVIIGDARHLPWVSTLPAGMLCGAAALALGRFPKMRLVAMLACCATLGAARIDWDWQSANADTVRHLAGRGEVTLQGVVVADPQWTEEGQRLIIGAERVQMNGKTRAMQGQVLVKLPPYPAYRYGDRLILRGELQTPRAAERPGSFDYQSYLARKHIFVLLTPQNTKLAARGQGNPALLQLLEWRDQTRRVLLRELPEPQSSLAIGILLGLQSSISDEVYDTFSRTGTSHILVISGWNITIIAMMLAALTQRLRFGRNTTLIIILGCIWLYTLFVGASATVIRAAVMGSVVVFGQHLDRPAHAWTTLLVACWAMSIWEPQTLWDLGFQLSALATASLFAFGKGTDKMLQRTPLRFRALDWAREALTATLAAQVLALPLILYHFGNLSLITPVANVLLLPVVPYAMLFGFVAGLVGLLSLTIGQWLATMAYLCLAWLTEGARLFAQVPYAAVQLPSFPLWMLLTYYGLVGGVWGWRQWKQQTHAAQRSSSSHV